MTPFAPSPPPFLYTTYHDETGIRFSFVPLFLPPFRPENDDSIPNGGGLCLRDRLDLKDLEFFFSFFCNDQILSGFSIIIYTDGTITYRITYRKWPI